MPRPGRIFHWNMDMYGVISQIFILQLFIWLISFSLTAMTSEHNHMCCRKHRFCFLFLSNPYILNMYIIGLNSRLQSQTIYVTYLDYIFPLLLCVNFPLAFKMGRFWNILESSPAKIPLIELSHKRTRILFYYLEFQTWNMDFQPAYNICKFSIQLIWCSDSRPYNTFSWNSSTLNSRLSTNYTLET